MDPALLPTPVDVARLLRARTKSPSGAELGVFTDETRPTGAQVTDLIAQASRDVDAAAGAEVPAEVGDIARQVVALRTALLVELSFYPEQVRQEQSAYAEYRDLYDQALRNLVARLADNTPRGNRTHSVVVQGFTAATASAADCWPWSDLRPRPLNPDWPLAAADVVMVQAPGVPEDPAP